LFVRSCRPFAYEPRPKPSFETPLRYETQLTYSIPLLRSAVFAYWKRSVGIVLPVAVAIVTVDLIFLIIRGDSSWVVGAMAMSVVIALSFVLALYLVHYRNALRKLREMGPPKARFVAEESTFTVESGMGASMCQWSAIKEIWTFPAFWLLLFSKAQFMTIPIACLTPDARAFVLERVRKTGGKIS
jgi:YcxB-like protein